MRRRRLTWREAIRIRGFRQWVASHVKGDQPYAVATRLIQLTGPAGLRRLVHRFRTRAALDPDLRLGIGRISGPPRAYMGRGVIDLGDRHAHAIVDVPWQALRVGLGKIRSRFDPWRHSIRGTRARLLVLRNPRPTDAGDRVITEVAVHVPRRTYNALRRSGEFEILRDGVLARRGRRKKATNIFVAPP